MLTAQTAKTQSRKDNLKRQKGIGLVEILVAVVLMSIGFLAAAQMQVQGMRFSQGAYLESQAYFMISDMMDRMRSNRDGVEGNAYSGKITSSGLNDPKCGINHCEPEKQAQQDLYDWSSYLFDLRGTPNFVPLLPGTTATPAQGFVIQRPNGVFTVGVSWNEKIAGTNKAQTLQLEFVP